MNATTAIDLPTQPWLLKCARGLIHRLPTGRSKCIQVVLDSLGFRGREFVSEFHQPSIRFWARMGETIDNQVYFNGVFEPIFTSLFLDLVEPGATFLDVGANMGYYTLLGWREVGERGRVYAFEPDPNSISRLERNLKLNQANHVTVIGSAVSNLRGTAKFHVSSSEDANQGNASLVVESETALEVPTITLDEFLEEHQLRDVGLLKMDIEGGEALAVQGMTRSIQSGVFRAILLEMHRVPVASLGTSPERILATFSSCGYSVYRVHGVTRTGSDKYRVAGQYELAEVQQADLERDLAHYVMFHPRYPIANRVQSHLRVADTAR